MKNLTSNKSNFTNGHFCDSKEINFLFLPDDSKNILITMLNHCLAILLNITF